jgi:DNA-binding beta-propeller fold protein YncE
MRAKVILLAIALVLPCTAAAAGTSATLTPIALPGGGGGIGFDDLGFSSALDRVLVPAGRTGNLDLIDPATRAVATIGGFSRASEFGGGHGASVTSADAGAGLIFATDRSAMRLDVVDPRARKIVASAALAAGPDYVRYLAATREVWVTEPRAARIEVFSLPPHGAPEPAHAGFIAVAGGPESLVIDAARGRAYANLWTDTTVAIDLRRRAIVARWANGCRGARGLALDAARGFLFVGCEEGRLAVLDLASGKQIGTAASGAGVDIIAYNPHLGHVYLPGAKSATMAIIAVGNDGAARVLGTVATARGAHCVVADERDNAYACDPVAGRLLVFHDALE